MELGVLGPLLVREGSRELALGGAKERALLAFLLLHPNETVSSERLIDALWPDDPPATARNALQVRVSNLRKLLGAERVETAANGYAVKVAGDELDLSRFRRLVAEARGDERAADKLAEAIALWRGNPLPEFAENPAFRAEIARLEEERLAALEERIEAELDLGRAAELVPELEGAVATNPLRERLMGQLMIALYRAGRQARALEVYSDARRRLVDELGLEPGPLLNDLHQRILGHDASLMPPPRLPAPAAESPSRRQVTVALAALPTAEALDPEVAGRTLDEARRAARSVFEDYGAVVSDRLGDAVIGAFGLPALREDDALRALQAALDISSDLGLRVAIDTRVALSSGEELVDDQLIGRLRRLVDVAGEAEVVVGEGTRKLATEAAELSETEVTGAWRLSALDPTAEPIARHFDTSLVGREQELSRLRASFEWSVGNRSSHLVTLVGPAGIGKSRLARELASAVSSEATVLSGRCLAHGSGAFWPLAEMVRQVAGDTTPDALNALLEKLEDRKLVVDQLAAALGTVPEMRAEDAFWAFRKLFITVAAERPLVLVFEDLHWAEERLLDFIEELVERAEDVPLLVLGLSRPDLLEQRESWGGGRLDAESVRLAPLSSESSRELIQILGRAVPEETRGRIATRAEGNPLFIEQLVALAAEDPAASADAIPLSLQAVLAARVDRLRADERALLERASIIGLEFSLAGVAALAPRMSSIEELTEVARRLVRKDLLRPVGPEIRGADGYRFLHLLIRDVVYASVLKATRAELHEKFARWLEPELDERANEVEEIIGFHLEHSYEFRKELDPEAEGLDELANEAGERLTSAGQRDIERSDVGRGVELLHRAVRLLSDTSSARGDTLARLSYAHRLRGEWAEAQARLEEAFAWASRFNDVSLAGYLQVSEVQLRLHTDPRFTVAEFLEVASRERARVSRDRRYGARVQVILAWPYALLGRHLVAQELVEGVDSRDLFEAKKLLPSLWLGGPMPVEEAIRNCEALLEDDPPPRTTASCYRTLAVLWAMLGEFERARELCELDQEILQELGLAVLRVGAVSNAASVEFLAGNPVNAERLLRDAIGRLHQLGATIHAASLSASLARSLLEQDRISEAGVALESADDGSTHDVADRVEVLSVRGRLECRRGQIHAAEAVAREAVAIADGTDSPDLQARARADLAEVLQSGDHDDEAHAVMRRSLELYEEKGNLIEAERAEHWLRPT